ncbi:uncharacterized protein [Ranitomeya imitator]|uniref:uncharacterized protein n=1 Tax=Ranitomeya imitator TaxID=111125 RepID=UPI0037E7A72A
MSFSEGSPPERQCIAEAEVAEGFPEEDEMGGEMPGAGAQSISQRAPDSDDEVGLDVDRLIEEVREREPLWNMADRRQADAHVTRRLWEEVCQNILPRWEDLLPRQQTQERESVRKRWRSLRDRFKREFNQEMQAPGGSAGRRRTRYKHSRALSFLWETMLSRTTVCSHRVPASTLDPSGAISQESVTEGHVVRPHPSDPSSDPSGTSAPSTSAAASSGASLQPSLFEAAGQDLAFPLPHPSYPASSRPPLGLWRQRQRGPERSYAPEFLHLNAAFQSSFKILGEQVTAKFNMMQTRMSEYSSRLDRLHSDASQAPNNLFFFFFFFFFFQSMLRSMKSLLLTCRCG